MLPTERKLAKLINELESVKRRLANLVAEFHIIEGESIALRKFNEWQREAQEAQERGENEHD